MSGSHCPPAYRNARMGGEISFRLKRCHCCKLFAIERTNPLALIFLEHTVERGRDAVKVKNDAPDDVAESYKRAQLGKVA